MKNKQTLRAFFINGGSGTNGEIAKAVGRSLGSVRKSISYLRHTHKLPIFKSYDAVDSQYAVYALDSAYRDGAHTVKGRPTLPKNRYRVF